METLPRDDVRLHIVTDALRRRFALIIVVAVAITGVVAGATLIRHRQYAASAEVLLRPISGNPLSPTSTANGQQVTVAMETEAGLVTSPGVVDLVNKKLGTSLDAGLRAVKATVPPNTEIVQIKFTGKTPAVAAQGAQAFAEAFLTYRQSQAAATQNFQLDSLQKQSKDAQDGLKKASAAAASSSAPTDAGAQVQLYASRLATLQDSIGSLLASNTDSGTVVTPAAKPHKPAGIPPYVFIAVAALMGLALGLILAIWRERKDDRVRTRSEVAIGSVPILSTLPVQVAGAPATIDHGDNEDPLHDAYRRARSGLVPLTTRPSNIMVSAVSAFEDSTVVAVNLAVSLASAGFRVTLVDATLGAGDVAGLLGIATRGGLSEALTSGEVDPDSLVEIDGMRVLTSGLDPLAAREFFAGSRLTAITDGLRADADYVVLAAPQATTPDANAVAVVGDGLVLAITDQQTTHQQVRDVVERALQFGLPTIGAIAAAYRGHRRGSVPARPIVPLTHGATPMPRPTSADAGAKTTDDDEVTGVAPETPAVASAGPARPDADVDVIDEDVDVIDEDVDVDEDVDEDADLGPRDEDETGAELASAGRPNARDSG